MVGSTRSRFKVTLLTVDLYDHTDVKPCFRYYLNISKESSSVYDLFKTS